MIIAAVALATLAGASSGEALAAAGYGGVAGQQTGGGSSATLPFTGVDLLLYVVVAVAIVASGLALQAIAGRTDH